MLRHGDFPNPSFGLKTRLDFDRFYLQPMDGPARAAHTEAAIAYCLEHPRWRLSVQTHKFLGIR